MTEQAPMEGPIAAYGPDKLRQVATWNMSGFMTMGEVVDSATITGVHLVAVREATSSWAKISIDVWRQLQRWPRFVPDTLGRTKDCGCWPEGLRVRPKKP